MLEVDPGQGRVIWNDEIRNRYAGAVPDAGDDRVRAAGQAHGGSDVSRQMDDRVVDRGDYSRGDTPR